MELRGAPQGPPFSDPFWEKLKTKTRYLGRYGYVRNRYVLYVLHGMYLLHNKYLHKYPRTVQE